MADRYNDPRHPGGDPYTPRDRRPVDVAYAEDHGSPGIGESNDPDQLQDEIELLQNRMAARLDSVTSAFTPQNLIAQATGEKNPDLFTTIDTVADAARRNPIAASLIGAGLASLLFSSRKPAYRPDPERLERERATYGVEGVRADGTRFSAAGVEGPDGHLRAEDPYADPAARHAVGIGSADVGDPDVDDRAHDPDSIEGVETRVRRLQDRAAARLGAATSAMSEALGEGRARVVGTYDRARGLLRSEGRDDGYERPGAIDWVRENPVPIGLAALAMGAVAAGYYTASKPEPRRRPLPRDRALVVADDYADGYPADGYAADGYAADRLRRDGETPMPVSASAPAPMGAGMTRTAAVGGSGQLADTDGGGGSSIGRTGLSADRSSASGGRPDPLASGGRSDSLSGTSGLVSSGPASSGSASSGSASSGSTSSGSTSSAGRTMPEAPSVPKGSTDRAPSAGTASTGSTVHKLHDRQGVGADGAGASVDDTSEATVELTKIYPRS